MTESRQPRRDPPQVEQSTQKTVSTGNLAKLRQRSQIYSTFPPAA